MKQIIIFLAPIIIFASSCEREKSSLPRVFVFTDINIDAGDPDDRQSLIHLLWYADELIIEGIVPDRWYAGGFEACMMALEAYSNDFQTYDFNHKGFPHPKFIRNKVATDRDHAAQLFKDAASNPNTPLYVLIWGNMALFGDILRQFPDLVENIRLITIGTHLMREEHIPFMPNDWEKTDQPCTQYNWNGFGRNEIFQDKRLNDMWWLEINWTYEGMFSGEEPTQMLDELVVFGSLGQHMKEVVESQPWAWYFRVGDTPSVLYLIDPDNNLDDPTHGSWAGRFINPFPLKRPNYYTDYNGPVEWDYHDPCNTWENHVDMARHAAGTLEKVRPQMYEDLLWKLHLIYGKNESTK